MTRAPDHDDRRSDDAPPRLLGPEDPAPYEVLRAGGRSPFVLTCDHAGKRVPAALDGLGLDAGELDRHIAWDRGAEALGRLLADALDAPLVVQRYSRLVIDCNRPLVAPDSIPLRSEDTEVPGNRALDAPAVEARRREIFAPYHDAIRGVLDARAASGQRSVLIALHSFTPVYRGETRPWDAGLLYQRYRALSRALLDELGRDRSLCLGDNDPYQVEDHHDYGIPVHGEARGLAHTLIEIRQDHLESDGGRDRWGDRVATALHRALETLPDDVRDGDGTRPPREPEDR